MSGPRGNDAARESTAAASTGHPWYRRLLQRRDAAGQPGSGIERVRVAGGRADGLMAGSVIVMAVDTLT